MFKRKLSVLAQLALLGSSAFAMDAPSITVGDVFTHVVKGTTFSNMKDGDEVDLNGVKYSFRGEGPSQMAYKVNAWQKGATIIQLFSGSARFSNDLGGNQASKNPAYISTSMSGDCVSISLPLAGSLQRHWKKGPQAHYPNSIFTIHLQKAGSYEMCNWGPLDSDSVQKAKAFTKFEWFDNDGPLVSEYLQAFETAKSSGSSSNSTANQDIAEQEAANQEVQTATKMAQEVVAVFNEARQDYKARNYESAEMRLKSLEDRTLPFLQKSLDEIRKQVASYSSLNLMIRFPQYLGYWLKATSEVQAFLGYNAEYRHKIFELRDLITEARKYSGSSYQKQQAEEDLQREEEERIRKEKARAEQERLRKEKEAYEEQVRKEKVRAEQERLRKEKEAYEEQVRKEKVRAEQERLRKEQEEYQRRYEEQERIRKAQEEQARREKARQEEARKSSSSSSNTGYGPYSYSKPQPQYEYSKPQPQYEYSEPKPQYEQPQYNAEADAQPKSGDVRTNNGKKERWNGSRWVRM